METFASSVSCWLANRERESTKGKFYYLEQILKTTETGKVLTCESERSKQLKVKVLHLEQISPKTSHSAQLQPYHQTMQMFRPEDRSLVSVKVPSSNSLVGDAVLCEMNKLNSLSTQVQYF